MRIEINEYWTSNVVMTSYGKFTREEWEAGLGRGPQDSGLQLVANPFLHDGEWTLAPGGFFSGASTLEASISPAEPIEMENEQNQTFTMDGEEHTVGPHCCAGLCDPPTCLCGGFWHYQPVYGGYYYECDKCHETTLNPNPNRRPLPEKDSF